jgi:hypothetical protein
MRVVSIYLDDDLNPLNTNQTLLRQINVPANGAGFVSFSATNLFIAASNATPACIGFWQAFRAADGRVICTRRNQLNSSIDSRRVGQRDAGRGPVSNWG